MTALEVNINYLSLLSKVYSRYLYTVGDDYTVVNQVLTFDAMTSRVCFFTSTVEDMPLEDDESYLLTLTSDEPGLTLAPPQATVTIIDDDGKLR